ncbi:hypothetical protein ACKI10_45810 [Streptomyces galilaeus]|uniref:FUSC family protein n=2 Tax=Streptomyces TaxID=1883 RepID=A0ABW9IYM8_STRGJ
MTTAPPQTVAPAEPAGATALPRGDRSIGNRSAAPLPFTHVEIRRTSSMHRPAVFAALLGLTRAASAIGDYWVNTAKAVSTLVGVSLPRGS